MYLPFSERQVKYERRPDPVTTPFTYPIALADAYTCDCNNSNILRVELQAVIVVQAEGSPEIILTTDSLTDAIELFNMSSCLLKKYEI
jgi:hypothetical protein